MNRKRLAKCRIRNRERLFPSSLIFEDEEVDRQGEVVDRTQYLKMITDDRDHLVQVEGSED